MSLASRMNAALAAVNVQFVRKTGLERLRLLEQEFQALLSEYQALKSRHERLSDRLHLPEAFFDLYPNQSLDLPNGASYFLIPSNTRLTDLTQRYRAINHPVMTASLWTDGFVQQEIDLYRFRADGGYVWQHREINTDLHYALCTYYLKSIDTLGLCDRLTEDHLFGPYTVQVEGRPVSRDLLDSLTEIYFLERHLGLSHLTQVNLLDIGAGYGRLAHRLAQALPNLGRVFCTDAIATSSFLCEYYLQFRGVDSMAQMVPFDELRTTLMHNPVQIATNIHSFSECPLDAIAGWLDLLAEFNIPYLMLVPNALDNGGTRLLSCEKDHSRIDYQPLLEKYGYQRIASDPKFLDPAVQANGISPTHHFLFQKQ
ncbi:MAG: putative sugar O-methyltransferase [Leptolyngbyaceae cyanobacterium bins.349]|nr:putative sugar O-methyltransferase [Leptolyngbyaceae cyanobacterium bins.349]